MIKIMLFTLAMIALTACGADSPANSTATKVEDDKQSSTVAGSRSEVVGLTQTPISFAEATGQTSKMVEVGPCPFISDEAIKASVRTNFEITRTDVSNKECRWSYNAGFSIRVTIEELSGAKPVSERNYNIGVDTTKEPQDGPGDNALVLNDTAWGRPIPFAYSFEKDGKLVFMRYTGFKTNTEIMRSAANEIADRMSNAPVIEAQRRQATQPFKACEIWSDQDIRVAFGAGDTAVIAPGASGVSNCSWTLYEDGVSSKRTVSYKISKPEPGKKAEYEYDSYESYSANGETHYIRKADSSFGMYVHVITPRSEGLVWVTVSDSKNDSSSIAETLHKNLLERMVP